MMTYRKEDTGNRNSSDFSGEFVFNLYAIYTFEVSDNFLWKAVPKNLYVVF